MYRTIGRVSSIRHCFAAPSSSSLIRSRKISLISIHRTFPATLYRYDIHRESKLYEKREFKLYLKSQNGKAKILYHGVEVQDGLVYPAITDDRVEAFLSRLPSLLNHYVCSFKWRPFMPNTFEMQFMARCLYDVFVHYEAKGEVSGEPHYLRILKGTYVDCLSLQRCKLNQVRKIKEHLSPLL